jgi:outer membrane protein
MKNRPRFLVPAIVALLCLAGAGQAAAQQITRIAVIDLQKVILAYSKDGAAYKDFELRKTQIQTEIDRMTDEIKKLQSQKVEADKLGDKTKSLRTESDIYNKTETLRDFVRAKQAELDDQAKKLASSSEFVQQVYKQIQSISEQQGYSIVLNLKSADSVMSAVVWYSSMIDITDEVIQALAPKTD